MKVGVKDTEQRIVSFSFTYSIDLFVRKGRLILRLVSVILETSKWRRIFYLIFQTVIVIINIILILLCYFRVKVQSGDSRHCFLFVRTLSFIK